MDKKEHIIWDSETAIDKDYLVDIKEDYPEYIKSEEDLLSLAYETNSWVLEDERLNLQSKDISTGIICYGIMSKWNGRHYGYKPKYEYNIGDCLFSKADKVCWYLDSNGDFRCDEVHYDGRNYFKYRAWREGISERQKGNFKRKIQENSYTRADENRYTYSLGEEIRKVYGWK